MGRFGYQEFGVPYSGVMDRQASAFSNAILGNPEGFAVLEIAMLGPKLQFNCSTSICISGADMSPRINKESIPNNKAISVKEGDILSFGKLKLGFRAYMAVFGGFKTENIMQSCSMYQGVTRKFKLEKGDLLHVEPRDKTLGKNHASVKMKCDYFTSKDIEVFKGPEFDKLSENQKAFLFSRDFTISKDNNRMAYQINEELENDLEPIITSLVLPGTVQLTPSGKLIVLMRDCQTTGGYPRVLQLKESSINTLSQKFTGATIKFKLL